MNSPKDYILIRNIFKEDQKDRFSAQWTKYSDKRRLKIISERDAKRRRKLKLIFSKKINLRGIDYFLAGLIMQHGTEKSDIREARRLAKKSYALGYQSGKWLYAASTDRLLIMSGNPQKFGTQFKRTTLGKWKLAPLNRSTTDSERRQFKVMPLKKINLVVSKLNSASGSKLFRRIGLTLLRS